MNIIFNIISISFHSVIIKTEPDETKATAACEITLVVSEHSPKSIKLENNNDADDTSDSDVQRLRSNSSTKPHSNPITEPNSSSLSPPAVIQIPDDSSKYCDVCNIKFNFLNSFIAHKTYYCKKVKTSVDGAPSVLVSANLSPNQTSVLNRTAEATVL